MQCNVIICIYNIVILSVFSLGFMGKQLKK